jgi:hypothetical protein
MSPDLGSLLDDQLMGESAIQVGANIKDMMKAFKSVNVESSRHTPNTQNAMVSPTAVQPPQFVVNDQSSRYYSDFQNHEYLGQGGFGAVVKAKNLIGTSILHQMVEYMQSK